VVTLVAALRALNWATRTGVQVAVFRGHSSGVVTAVGFDPVLGIGLPPMWRGGTGNASRAFQGGRRRTGLMVATGVRRKEDWTAHRGQRDMALPGTWWEYNADRHTPTGSGGLRSKGGTVAFRGADRVTNETRPSRLGLSVREIHRIPYSGRAQGKRSPYPALATIEKQGLVCRPFS